ncbi:MAG: 50S ribosomal protein L4 [Elusimicrobiota bacterium]
MELIVIDNKGQKSGSFQFDEKLVETKASKAVLHEVIVAYQAAQRSGTHSVKTRAQVSGGGIKPWKQKGTGRARSGSTRSPLWRHGGIIFGPVERDYRQNLPKSKKHVAFRMAVKLALDENRMQVVDPVKLKEAKTKNVADVYAKWKAPTGSVFIVDKIDPKFNLASRNIPSVEVSDVESVNTLDVLKARQIYITSDALTQLSERINKSLGK